MSFPDMIRVDFRPDFQPLKNVQEEDACQINFDFGKVCTAFSHHESPKSDKNNKQESSFGVVTAVVGVAQETFIFSPLSLDILSNPELCPQNFIPVALECEVEPKTLYFRYKILKEDLSTELMSTVKRIVERTLQIEMSHVNETIDFREIKIEAPPELCLIL